MIHIKTVHHNSFEKDYIIDANVTRNTIYSC